MKIEFDSREEAKAFHDALMYGMHGISGVAIKVNGGHSYTIINKETGESAFISSRSALVILKDIMERIEEDEYKTNPKRI